MRLPPAHCGLFLFAAVLAYSYGGAQVFGDPDTAWHIATGDLIRQLGSIPMEDTWSFAANGEIWYNLSWLFDIGFSALFAAGGFTALYILTLLAFAGSYVFMANECLKRGASFLAVSISMLIAILVSFNSILARPNLSSIILSVALYHMLSRYRDTHRTGYLVALPLLMALWVNLHGGYLLAFPVIGVFFVEAWLQKNYSLARTYCITGLACVAATLLNPYGYAVYYGAYKTLSLGFDQVHIVEWQSVNIGKDLPLTLMLLLVLFTGNVRDKAIPFSDKLVAIALLFMALNSQRHGAVAGALAMPYISLRLTHFWNEGRFGAWLAPREALIMQDMYKNDVKWMGAIMAVIAVALAASPFPRDMFLKDPPGFPKKSFPIKEAEFIAKKYPKTRFMTDYNIGGYLVYIWRGDVKVFVDGRASSLYSKETLQDYADFAMISKGYGGRAKMIADYYGFEGVVIPNEDPGSAEWHWNPDWKLVYNGDVAAVYLRNTKKVNR